MSWEDPTYADLIGGFIGWAVVTGLALAILPYVSPVIIGLGFIELVKMYKKIQEKKRK